MAEYQEVTRKEWKESLLVIAALVVVIVIGAVFMIPDYWYGFIILVVAVMCAVIIIVIREQGPVVFKCPKCGQEFEISAFKNVMSPHGVSKKEGKWYEWKYLECPVCHEKLKMFPVKEREQPPVL